MIQCSLKLVNKLGLHARAAMKLSDLSTRYGSKITLKHHTRQIDAKNILDVMSLGASFGQTIELSCDGNDEKQAQTAITELVSNRFGEEN